MKTMAFLLGAGLALLLSSASLHAQEIPTYPTLPCQGACPEYTPPVRINVEFPKYGFEHEVDSEEGIVDLSFTVGADGSTKNPIVEKTIGAKVFLNSVLKAVAATRYTPATENGKPVESNQRARYIFMINGDTPTRAAVSALYRDALAKQDNPTEAIAALKGIENRTELSLYESTMVAYAAARIEAKATAYNDALQDIEVATVDDGKFLGSKEKEQALRLRIVLDADAGQYGDAFETFDALKKLNITIADSDPQAQLIAKLHAEIDSPKPLWADAKIPADNPVTVWNHTMLRRSFGFANIKGSLSKFDLRCETHGIESPVSDGATWTIPPSWAKCNILVEGTPGTTFKFGEAQPDATATPNQR